MSLISVVRYTATSTSSRDVLIDRLLNLTRSVDDRTTKFAICTPWDAIEDGPIITITAFASQDAHQSYVSNAAVTTLMEETRSQNLLKSSPESFLLDPVASFTKDEALKEANFETALVLFASTDMHPNAFENCMPAINAVRSYCESQEPGSYEYQICKDAHHGEAKGYVVEVYESASYFQDPHMKAAPVQEVMERVRENADYKDFLQLKVIGGFLAR